MTRLCSLPASRFAALAVLAAVLAAPASHGAFAHGHFFCHDETTIAAMPSGSLADSEVEVCPVCFAIGQVRTAIGIALPRAADSVREAIPHAAPQRPSASVDLALAAPRAPPLAS